MRQTTAPGLRPYEQTLCLTWPLSYWLSDQAETVSLTSHPSPQRHEVVVPIGATTNPVLWMPDIVQALCKAALAERLDPAFSTLFFAKRYGTWRGQRQKQFEKKARQLFWAWSHVDLWASDLRQDHWPELTKGDHESFALSVQQLSELGQWEALQTNEGIFSMAQQMAEIERRNLEPLIDFWAILQDLESEWRDKHRALYEHYLALPRLAYDQEADIATLVRTVQEVASLLHFPIQPQLVEEENRLVWHI